MSYQIIQDICIVIALALLALTFSKLLKFKVQLSTYYWTGLCLLMATGSSLLFHHYGIKIFVQYYSGTHPEGSAAYFRMFGAYGWAFWFMLGCYTLPLLLLIPKLRKSLIYVATTCFFTIFAGLFERFVIIITSF